jgi:signal transduction histidine kinase
VLINLIGNAIKFSKPMQPIEVRVQPDSSNSLLFSISDRGIGIPEEQQDLLFQKFVQLKAR